MFDILQILFLRNRGYETLRAVLDNIEELKPIILLYDKSFPAKGIKDMLGVLDLWSTFKTCEYKDHDDFGSLPRDLIPSALHYKCHIGNQEGLGQNWCVECMLGRRDHDADRGDKWFEYHMILMPLEYVKRRNWQIKERDPTTIDNRTRGSNIFASAKRAAIKNLKYAKKDPGQHHLYTHYSPILYALEILRILRIDVACVGIAGILKCADCGNPCDHLQHDHLWDPDADKKSPMELVENLRMAICKRDNVLSRSVLDGWVAGRYIYPGILATDSMEEFIEILGKYLNDEIVDKRISDSLRQKFFAFWSTRDPSKPKQDVVDQFKKDREYQSLVQTTKRCYLSGQIRQTQLSLACEHNHDTGCLRGLVNCQLNWRLPESAKTPEGREQLLVTGKNLDKRYLRDALLYILQSKCSNVQICASDNVY